MPSKAKLKQYQQLHSKKFRQKYNLFVVEGLKSVNELVQSSWSVECILCTPHFEEQNRENMTYDAEVISDEDFKAISHLSNPQEILAIAKIMSNDNQESNWQIALDGINDPGNFGTIIRIADWYGINTIYCSKNTVDFYNNKTIQSTMGSFLRVQVIEGDLANLLKNKKCYATLLDGKNIRSIENSTQGVIIIGNEANGISDELLSHIEYQAVTIPGSGTTESLNAAMATAICCERLIGG